jgi:hypothetical protein
MAALLSLPCCDAATQHRSTALWAPQPPSSVVTCQSVTACSCVVMMWLPSAGGRAGRAGMSCGTSRRYALAYPSNQKAGGAARPRPAPCHPHCLIVDWGPEGPLLLGDYVLGVHEPYGSMGPWLTAYVCSAYGSGFGGLSPAGCLSSHWLPHRRWMLAASSKFRPTSICAPEKGPARASMALSYNRAAESMCSWNVRLANGGTGGGGIQPSFRPYARGRRVPAQSPDTGGRRSHLHRCSGGLGSDRCHASRSGLCMVAHSASQSDRRSQRGL